MCLVIFVCSGCSSVKLKDGSFSTWSGLDRSSCLERGFSLPYRADLSVQGLARWGTDLPWGLWALLGPITIMKSSSRAPWRELPAQNTCAAACSLLQPAVLTSYKPAMAPEKHTRMIPGQYKTAQLIQTGLSTGDSSVVRALL